MYQLQVDDMSCSHCVNAVTKAVQALDPQAQVQVDLAGKRVTVDSHIALERISAAISEAGFPVHAAH